MQSLTPPHTSHQRATGTSQGSWPAPQTALSGVHGPVWTLGGHGWTWSHVCLLSGSFMWEMGLEELEEEGDRD